MIQKFRKRMFTWQAWYFIFYTNRQMRLHPNQEQYRRPALPLSVGAVPAEKLLCMMAGLLITSCASVDHGTLRKESLAMPAGETAKLDKSIAPLTEGQDPKESGFYVLADNVDAIAARLRLAAEAERSIDVQYYLIKRDQVGNAFLYALLLAADRGVRVRLLLDDMFNQGFDQGMRALDAHPNIELRVYNPFNRGLLGRNLGALLRLRTINRRMHNKSFTVDGRVTVIGGRNIADEYFGARPDSAFGDLDVLCIGPVVQDVAEMFDTYWIHETAVPLDGFLKPLKNPPDALDAYRVELKTSSEALRGTRYAQAVIDRAYQEIQKEMPNLHWAPYTLMYDTPDKGIKNRAEESAFITDPLRASLSGLEHEIFICSPYFVPWKDLTDGLIDARKRGIEVSVLTNSLAANNQKTVHGGYAPSRKKLLKAGVKLYEVRPDAIVRGNEYVEGSDSRATLHSKSYLMDRQDIFIGSFNFDPRSAFINTEMGVLIRNPELADEFIVTLEKEYPEAVWEVTLTEKNNLRWTGLEEGKKVTHGKEPMTNWWQRFVAGFYRLLPIRSQL